MNRRKLAYFLLMTPLLAACRSAANVRPPVATIAITKPDLPQPKPPTAVPQAKAKPTRVSQTQTGGTSGKTAKPTFIEFYADW